MGHLCIIENFSERSKLHSVPDHMHDTWPETACLEIMTRNKPVTSPNCGLGTKLCQMLLIFSCEFISTYFVDIEAQYQIRQLLLVLRA